MGFKFILYLKESVPVKFTKYINYVNIINVDISRPCNTSNSGVGQTSGGYRTRISDNLEYTHY